IAGLKRRGNDEFTPEFIMAFLTLLALAVPSFLVYYVISYYWWVSKYPRGPLPYPIVGNLRQLSSDKLHLQFRELSLKYGPIFTVFLPVPVVVITSYDGVKEAYVTKADAFAARPHAPPNKELGINGGIINANGQSWLENRRLTISILRDFGMGKSLMEEQVNLSIAEFLRHLESIENKDSVDLRWSIQMMVANIINETLFGFRYPYDDCEAIVDFVTAFSAMMEMSLSNLVIRFSAYTLRYMNYIPGMQLIAKRVYGPRFAKIKSFIGGNTEKAMASFNEDGDDSCFVHAYSRKIGTSPYITQQQLFTVCMEVFAAGQETTTTTLRWATLLLAENQAVQDKAREEILRVVGTDRLPSLADKPRMPYTTALVHEVQRRANILQVNVNRRATEDVEIMGHLIPEATTLIGEVYQIMAHDPIFENPDEFRPERYLSEDGTTLKKDLVDRTMPFSLGKRQCAGEGLARVELFLGIAAILQNYRLLPTDDSPIDLRPHTTVNMMPKQQNLKLVPLSTKRLC
ncbi:hypothetical protein PMAYCL1PPCAC_16874, partial [Pristionchus mayeri]